MEDNRICSICDFVVYTTSDLFSTKTYPNLAVRLKSLSQYLELELFSSELSQNPEFSTKLKQACEDSQEFNLALCQKCKDYVIQLSALCNELEAVQKRVTSCLAEFSQVFNDDPRKYGKSKETITKRKCPETQGSSDDKSTSSKKPRTSTQTKTQPWYQCRHCNFQSRLTSKVQEHFKTTHPEEHQRQQQLIPTCSKCSKTFITTADLEKHFQMFCTKHTYNTHHVLMSAAKQEKQSNSIYVKSTSKYQVNISEEYNKNQDVVHCDICLIPFASKNTLTVHMKKIHPVEFKARDEAPKTCEVCGQVFKSRYTLYTHKKTCQKREEMELKEKQAPVNDPLEIDLAGSTKISKEMESDCVEIEIIDDSNEATSETTARLVLVQEMY